MDIICTKVDESSFKKWFRFFVKRESVGKDHLIEVSIGHTDCYPNPETNRKRSWKQFPEPKRKESQVFRPSIFSGVSC